jgi:hypothetical protein
MFFAVIFLKVSLLLFRLLPAHLLQGQLFLQFLQLQVLANYLFLTALLYFDLVLVLIELIIYLEQLFAHAVSRCSCLLSAYRQRFNQLE